MISPMILFNLIDLYSLVVLAAVVISWIDIPRNNSAVRLVHALTEPLLAPIRRRLPTLAGLDFSPMILLVLLQVVLKAVLAAMM